MQNYLDLLKDIIDNGTIKEDRTGVGTISLFGRQIRFDLEKGFPLVTTKKLHLKSIIYELLWFLKGDTNIKYLKDNNVRIWDEWADENGDLGPVYGKQWRSWETPNGETIDQIKNVIKSLKETPESRRHIVSAWNVSDIPNMALAPCHCLFQFNTREISFEERVRICEEKLGYRLDDGYSEELFEKFDIPKYYLDCQLYQRSADAFLGVPFNIASYSLLLLMIAKECNMVAKDFVHTFGDVHIYSNHIAQINVQLGRIPFDLPTLKLNEQVKSIFDYDYSDFIIENYNHHSILKGKVAV